MAKVKMVCPLSGNPCKDCAIYRGRHYFLCFSGDYRGRVADAEEPTKTSESLASEMRSSRKFEMPRNLPTKNYEPERAPLHINKKEA